MSDGIIDGLEASKTILNISGNWPESPTAWSKIRGLVCLSIATIFVITLTMELVHDLRHQDEALSEHLAIMITATHFLFKIVIFRGNYKQFLTLLEQLDVEIFNNHPKHLDYILKNSTGQVAVVGRIYRSVCYSVVVIFCVTPFIAKEDLPISFSYNLGPFKRVMHILQILGIANAVFVNSNLDVLAVDLMVIAGIQIDILNKKIIGFKTKSTIDEAGTGIYMSNLTECIKHHNEIIRYIENMQGVFSYIFLVQYLTSAFIICNIGFELVHVELRSFQFVNMMFHFMALTGQLGLYCWYGNEIIRKSTKTKDACYESDWTGCEIKVLKLLIIITERTKRPLFLTAGKFATLSLEAFGAILNTAYSYFTLLQNLYGEEED